MLSVSHWTPEQWAAFTGVLTSGLAAVALLALAIRHVRGWTAPAHPHNVRPLSPRPTLALAARRIPAAELDAQAARWRAADAAQATAALAPVVDPTTELLPDVAEHLAEGPGSISSILREEGHFAPRAELIDPEVRDWFAEAFDRVLSDFRTAVEPAMRTARLWEIQGRGVNGHTSARQALDRWRIESPTGEYALVVAAS